MYDDGNRRELADGVGARQQAVARRHGPVPESLCLRPQHQVREIDVPRVRRNVWALRHVADVAQVALVDDFPVVGLGDAVHLHRRAFVDEVEQRRKGAAQRYAPATAVADVEDALLFLLQRVRVEELRVAPIERVTRRRLQVAFAKSRAVPVAQWLHRAARR